MFFPLFDQRLDINNDKCLLSSYAQRLLLIAKDKIEGKDFCNRALPKISISDYKELQVMVSCKMEYFPKESG